jgi:high-affinity nickel permease
VPIGIRLQNLRESPAVTTISILSIGFLVGMKHATEADHVAAVATLAAGRDSFAQTLKQGMAWGIGHTATLMLFGGFVLALGTSVPPQLADALELAVGVMLIALGADVLRRVRRGRIHFHAHDHRRA